MFTVFNWEFINVLISQYINIQKSWFLSRLSKVFIINLLIYTFLTVVPTFSFSSVLGFCLLLTIIFQMFSGLFLALQYIPDPSFVIIYREELCNESLFFFFIYKIHVIGVDTIFFFSYLHIFKKLFLKNYINVDALGWMTGVTVFLVYHLVVFFGIVLGTSHLADVTITIAANIFWSLFNSLHKTYCIFFTNKHLNVDQLCRFALLHYYLAFYFLFLVQLHIMFIHERWEDKSINSISINGNFINISWFFDALKKEIFESSLLYFIIFFFFCFNYFFDKKAINYNFFEQWSESECEDINYYHVAPHWYFRPHMGLLIVCASHYEGLFWLIMFYILLGFLPAINNLYFSINNSEKQNFSISVSISLIQKFFFFIFLISVCYIASILPFGRFFYDLNDGFFGSILLKIAYIYVYLYLAIFIHITEKIEFFFLNFFKKIIVL